MRRKNDPIERKIMMAILRSIIKVFSLPFRKFFPNKEIDRLEIYKSWQGIEQEFKLSPQTINQIIIKADNLLDQALKKISFGNNLGERLKNAQSKFSSYESYQAAWEAHKVRNRLAHELNHGVSEYEAKVAIEKYRKALRGLGVL